MSRVHFTKLHPLPAYTGPVPVYRCSFDWAGSVDCLVRKNRDEFGDAVWETSELIAPNSLARANFSACPVAGAANTRYGAVMAFDYHHNRLMRGDA